MTARFIQSIPGFDWHDNRVHVRDTISLMALLSSARVVNALYELIKRGSAKDLYHCSWRTPSILKIRNNLSLKNYHSAFYKICKILLTLLSIDPLSGYVSRGVDPGGGGGSRPNENIGGGAKPKHIRFFFPPPKKKKKKFDNLKNS